MADPKEPASNHVPRAANGLFDQRSPEPRQSPALLAGIVAGALLLCGFFLLAHGKKPGAAGTPDTLRPLAAYGSHLTFSGLAMSESTSLSGGKSTFIDGRVMNTGSSTVTGVILQVLFAPDGGGAPQLETVPLSLVRTRQPYLDTEPVSAAPLAPGGGADFRLIFEGIRPEWNQQVPEIHVVAVETR